MTLSNSVGRCGPFWRRLRLGLVAVLVPASAHAAETVTYRYDAKGRLTQVARSGSANNGVVTTYAFDKADNRTDVIVSGSPFNNAPQRAVVVPLGRLSVIALPNS